MNQMHLSTPTNQQQKASEKLLRLDPFDSKIKKNIHDATFVPLVLKYLQKNKDHCSWGKIWNSFLFVIDGVANLYYHDFSIIFILLKVASYSTVRISTQGISNAYLNFLISKLKLHQTFLQEQIKAM